MADQVPSGEQAAYAFLAIVALVVLTVAAESFRAGEPWTVWGAWSAGGLAAFLVGIAWARIRALLNDRTLEAIEWLLRYQWFIFAAVAAYFAVTRPERFYRLTALNVAVSCVLIICLGYVRALRRDLDRYVMPRRVTRRQARRLQNYLAQHEQPQSITISSVSGDSEAHRYADQIFGAFRDGGWNAQFIGVPPHENLGDGVRIFATGSLNRDPNLGCEQAIQRALNAAHIRWDGSAGVPGPGQYSVHLVIGKRPLAIYPWQPTLLTRFGHFIARMGRPR